MNDISRITAIFITLTIIWAATCQARVIRTDSYAEGLKAAKKESAILVVLVHGSGWNTWSQQVKGEIFDSASFEGSLPDATIVFADVEILQSPDEAGHQKDHQEQAAAAFKKALEIAPASFAGQMAERILTAWYK